MVIPKYIGVLFCIYIFGYLCYIIYYALGLYHINPFIRLKKLTITEKNFLGNAFPIYHKLPQKIKEKCDQRIIWFRSRKKFVFYGDVAKQDELRLLLSASAVFMMLGLKNYRMTQSVLRVIIYPSKYYSRINKRHHLGEYNPGFKSVIFSADTILKGFSIPDDNINLAMHEFAHALCFEMVKKNTWEARRFRVGLKKIKELFAQEDFQKKIAASEYFRAYGLTNLQEFFSVAVESYVETPKVFLNDFPELYEVIQRMLNFDFQQAPIVIPPKRIF
ncbi:zinc-dependent peptidase [Aurantibacter crassamenti]|uniref:zinc-dependent peptidase n=1 Tax=Aurantibacter crassamenti TaxID=1837375 RepID=UPI0019392AA7|nr:zinc-dependent peptidase [Aurantibacter crassamenti]MBM1106149.1 zinc-dependent peptidase [Aurantibacter crassamenti]